MFFLGSYLFREGTYGVSVKVGARATSNHNLSWLSENLGVQGVFLETL